MEITPKAMELSLIHILDICHQAKQLPLVEKFKGDSLTFVAGSSWGPDEDIFIKYFNEHPEMKLVIACLLYTSNTAVQNNTL